MGLFWRKSKRLGATTINVTNGRPSVSRRVGRVRVSSRGRGSVRLGKGISFRFKL